MRYSEEQLQFWTAKLSDTEDRRAENAVNMAKKAISEHDKLRKMNIEVFTQGSYANNTNVRTESDVDVCVMLKGTFHPEYASGKCGSDYGFVDSELTFDNYRDMVKEALVSKFGITQVKDGNKSIKIEENTYHVNADVVPSFQLRNYYYHDSILPERYVEGIWFVARDGEKVSNYPKVHVDNGKMKNNASGKKYKKLVRLLKHIKNDMVDNGFADGNTISSFLIECLVWNVPNSIITGYSTWTETIRQVIIYLYNEIDNNKHQKWGEVSEMLYLFKNRKWTDQNVKDWLISVWTYMEYR